MKIAVLGCGRWGTFHAWYANSLGHDVTLWGRDSSTNMKNLMKQRKNEYLSLPTKIKLSTNLSSTITDANICIISIGAQNLRSFLKTLKSLDLSPKPLVLCMKGLEENSGKRLSEVTYEEMGKEWKTAVWVGPGHVQDFIKGIPNCMLISSNEKNFSQDLIKIFSSPLIRFYLGEDLLGTEIGAAAKNVIGIAAGMLDGLSYSSLKGALMSRGTKELSRLIEKMGGNPNTIYGLSHLGDYEATLFSKHSNNRKFGEDYIKNITLKKLAEGVRTSEALVNLSKFYNVELPICSTVCEIICHGKNPQIALNDLFLRSIKEE